MSFYYFDGKRAHELQFPFNLPWLVAEAIKTRFPFNIPWLLVKGARIAVDPATSPSQKAEKLVFTAKLMTGKYWPSCRQGMKEEAKRALAVLEHLNADQLLFAARLLDIIKVDEKNDECCPECQRSHER